MKADVKAKWLEALRSGKYGQAHNVLRSGDGERFCCLGVLCELHSLETRSADWRPNTDGEFEYIGNVTALPLEVQRWARVRTASINLRRTVSDCSTLAELNDSGANFKEIADVIEKQL